MATANQDSGGDPYYDVALLFTYFECDECGGRLDYDDPYDPDVFASKAKALDWFVAKDLRALCPACRAEHSE
jgi:hypothetical protein